MKDGAGWETHALSFSTRGLFGEPMACHDGVASQSLIPAIKDVWITTIVLVIPPYLCGEMYFNSSFVFLFSLVGLRVAGQDTNLKTVKHAFETADIPSNLTVRFNPTVLLEVSLPQTSGRTITLHAGIQLPRNVTVGPPSFSICGAGTGPFMIVAVDPNATPPFAQVRHFLGGSFYTTHDSSVSNVLRNSTLAISEYVQPNPPTGSDAHRYIFLLFNQSPEFNDQTIVTATTPITSFNISQFVAVTNLGDPIGGTFMLVAPVA